MPFLGSFAAAAREAQPERTEWDTFDFAGEKFVVTHEMPAVLVIQLAAALTGRIEQTEGMAAMWEAMRIALGEKGFQKWYKLAVDNAVGMEDVAKLVLALFEAQDGRPTVEASASSAGPTTTSPSSSASSSHPALAHLTPVSQLVLAG